jgi:hypothetical protein
MSAPFPTVLVGQPVRHQAISVFPLFTDSDGSIDYLLSDEAIGAGAIEVQEVSEGGSVPELLVENKGHTRVLFIEGEQLIGAKQNRILNTSVLIAANSRVKIPVSCVEQGRWAYRSKHFGSSDMHSPSKLRHTLKKSVNFSLSKGEGHRSDQGGVWKEVAELAADLEVGSATGALSDSFAAYETRTTDVLSQLPYPEGATGMAVAIGGRVVALDVFDKPATLAKAWRRLLRGFALESAGLPPATEQVTVAHVEELVTTMTTAAWSQVPPVGEGDEFRADTNAAHASALTLAGALVHGSVLVGGR